MSKPMTTPEQARADAVADAETLRNVAYHVLGTSGGREWLAEEARRPLDIPTREQASAREIARAAFRACPMLRGE